MLTNPALADEAQDPLSQYLNRRVSELIHVPLAPISEGDAERRRIYAFLLMKLVSHYWNGNKHGQEGEYPGRKGQLLSNGLYRGDRYLGHNIACLAVDGDGEVIDFDFNHNEIFCSSVEHAESRLVRRVFSLTQISDNWQVRDPDPRALRYSNILEKVTIYTSLESCAQCAGIMALGRVRDVVYLQRDPGMYKIGNILRNLSSPELKAPEPIPASAVGLPHYDALERAYANFCSNIADEPFYKWPDGRVEDKPSLTSFLCTDAALKIFSDGAAIFDALTLNHAEHKPDQSGNYTLTNQRVLDRARRFFRYASTMGRRGTPHQL